MNLKKHLDENAPIDKIKELSEKFQQTIFAISSAAYQQASAEQPSNGEAGHGSSETGSNSDDDVIDAEYSKS